jgi:hypothetical protein
MYEHAKSLGITLITISYAPQILHVFTTALMS